MSALYKNLHSRRLVCRGFILITLLSLQLTQGYPQSDVSPVQEIQDHRQKQQDKLRDKGSPLDKKARKHFKGLNYYDIDLSYRVKVRFVKTENPVIFQMKTTTNRLPEYIKYGDVFF